MMDSANEAPDHAGPGQRRQSVAGDRVLRVPHIEPPPRRRIEIGQVVLDPGAHQIDQPARNRPSGHTDRAALDAAKEPRPRDIGRVDDRVDTLPGQRLGQFQRMDHTAARVGRVRKDRDPHHGPHPINARSEKSQIVSRAPPSRIATRRSAVATPISAAAIPRAAKRATTAVTSSG